MNHFIKLFLLIFLLTNCDQNEELTPQTITQLQAGAGSFVYDKYLPFENKPIEVHYYIPENADQTLPILIYLHGMGRNGSGNRDAFINLANQDKFIVIVPEFSNDYFPGGDSYNLANIFIDGDNPSSETLNPSEQWTFAVLDPLFIYFKSLISNYSDKYNLIGFSAGGQVAHRTFIYSNSNYCNQTISMGSGWYTTINENLDFPYGLRESPYNSSLASIFSKDLTILVGENDNDPNAPNLRRNSIVDQQGDNRFDRAEYFFSTAQNIALQENYIFNWQKYVVPNAAHDAGLVSTYAINLLYP